MTPLKTLNCQASEKFLTKMAEAIAPFLELPRTDGISIPLKLTVPLTNLKNFTSDLFEISEIQIGKNLNGSVVFYFIGETEKGSGFEIGRINPEGEVEINLNYIFRPRDLKNVLALIPQNIGA